MDVDGSGNYLGCDNNDRTQDNCSSATVLSDDDFDYKGTTYTITQLYWIKSDESLQLVTGAGDQSSLGPLTLNVGGTLLRVADVADIHNLGWDFDPTPEWADGDTVALSLTEPTNPTSATTTGGRPIQVDGASIAGWSIEEGTAKKKVGRIGPTDASIPASRWRFAVNTLATKFSSGMSVLTPATNYFTVAANGRVSYTGANPRVSGRTYTGMGTAFLTITISDSKEKASDLQVTLEIAMQAQPTLSARASSISGWTIEDGKQDRRIGKIKINEIGDKRTQFTLDRAFSELNSAELSGLIAIDADTGIVSYDGGALVASGVTASYPHDIELDVTVEDKKDKFADVELEIVITVTKKPPLTIKAIGAPYDCCWEITVGTPSDNIGTVYGAGSTQSMVKRLRYRLLGTGGADLFGFRINQKTGIVSYRPDKAPLAIPETAGRNREPVTSMQLHIEVYHKDGYAETMQQPSPRRCSIRLSAM